MQYSPLQARSEDLGVLIQNTKSMDLQPESPAEFDTLDRIVAGRSGMKLLPVFTGAAFQEHVNFPVIVEMWEKKGFGKGKRRWLAEFTEAERAKISAYHGRFYRWHLKSGVPDTVACRLNTLALLQRAVAFFASL